MIDGSGSVPCTNVSSTRVEDGWSNVPTDIKNSVTVNTFKNGLQKTHRRIGGSHIRSKDWRKDEVDVLLESTIVSEKFPWDQRDSRLQVRYPSSGSGSRRPKNIRIWICSRTWRGQPPPPSSNLDSLCGCLLKSTIVSEKFQWDQRDSTYKYISKEWIWEAQKHTDTDPDPLRNLNSLTCCPTPLSSRAGCSSHRRACSSRPSTVCAGCWIPDFSSLQSINGISISGLLHEKRNKSTTNCKTWCEKKLHLSLFELKGIFVNKNASCDKDLSRLTLYDSPPRLNTKYKYVLMSRIRQRMTMD